MKPLVSVFMPCFNQEEYIEESIEGALDQDYPNYEVVIGDDGSTDGTVDIIKRYARRFPDRIVPLINQEHLGITGNCNRTLRACKGKYIAFDAGDDVFLPGKLSAQVAWLEEDESRVLCAHQANLIDEDSRIIGLLPETVPSWAKENRGNKWLVRYGNFLPGVSVMARRSSLPIYGFDERFPLVSDWKLWIDSVGRDGVFGSIDGAYANYRVHSGGVTKKKIKRCTYDAIKTLVIVANEDKSLFLHAVPGLVQRLLSLMIR